MKKTLFVFVSFLTSLLLFYVMMGLILYLANMAIDNSSSIFVKVLGVFIGLCLISWTLRMSTLTIPYVFYKLDVKAPAIMTSIFVTLVVATSFFIPQSEYITIPRWLYITYNILIVLSAWGFYGHIEAMCDINKKRNYGRFL